MEVIIVTGSVGTGKTELATKLAKKLNFYYVNANKVIKKYDISEGHDKKRKTKIVDVKKLNRALIKEIDDYKKLIKSSIKKYSINNNSSNRISNKKLLKNKINIDENKIYNKKIKSGLVIDSHLSHYLPKKYVDLCIVTKCGLKQLEKRLKKRGYSKSKIRENLDAEIFDVCLSEAKENKHKVIIIDTTEGININGIIKQI